MATLDNTSSSTQVDDVLLVGFGAVGVICELYVLYRTNAYSFDTIIHCIRCPDFEQESKYKDYSHRTGKLREGLE